MFNEYSPKLKRVQFIHTAENTNWKLIEGNSLQRYWDSHFEKNKMWVWKVEIKLWKSKKVQQETFSKGLVFNKVMWSKQQR